MKNKFCWLKTFCLVMLAFAACLFCVPTLNSFAAEPNNTFSVADDNFSMQITARGRTSNKLETESVEFEGITFQTFKWRQLESLSFLLTGTNNPQTTNFQLKVTNLYHHTNLSSQFGTGTTSTLYHGTNFNQFMFFYYIDSTADNTANPNSSNGKDFGLYKFDFSYTLKDGKHYYFDFYVQIIPDDINRAIPQELSMLYSVSSASKLLNKYSFYLTTDTFKYVNPALLTWEVTGEDVEGNNYCYDIAMQQRYAPQYDAYNLIYPSTKDDCHGDSFVFDSNNIEGTWTVKLKIANNQQTEFVQEDLSTIKVQKKSITWLIILLSILALALISTAIIVILMIKHKKQEKIW